MPDEISNIHEIKTTSDGSVKISVEKYNELLENITSQKGLIRSLNDQLREARNVPPVINRTIINKTPEMAAQEFRWWGVGLMGLGAPMFILGALLYKNGRM